METIAGESFSYTFQKLRESVELSLSPASTFQKKNYQVGTPWLDFRMFREAIGLVRQWVAVLSVSRSLLSLPSKWRAT